jgi:hypothetical protein
MAALEHVVGQGTHKLQQEATTVQQPAATMQRKDSHTLSSTKSYSRQAGRLQQQAQQLALDRAGMADAKQGSSSAKESYLQPPNMTSKASVQHMPPAALPPLPPEVVLLIDEVFTFAAGPSAATAVRDFLQSQRVTSLDDFNYLELPWLQVCACPGPYCCNWLTNRNRRNRKSQICRKHMPRVVI